MLLKLAIFVLVFNSLAVFAAVPDWLDAYFYYDLSKTPANKGLSLKSFNDLGLSNESMAKIFDSYSTSFGEAKLENGAYVDSFRASLDYLKTQKDLLSTPEKLGLMSVMLDRYAKGYSKSFTNNPDMEALFQNAVQNRNDGGKCGDIHTAGAFIAAALGFDDAGVHSLLTMKDLESGKPAGHVIAHFRDPKTGEYYVQDYSIIFNTRQSTLVNAVELSTRVMAPFVSMSEVSSAPGQIHIYIPQTTLWVKTQILQQATSPKPFDVSVRASQHERSLGLSLNKNGSFGRVGVFAKHSEIGTEGDEKYRLDLAGASFWAAKSKKVSWGPIDEIGFEASAIGGGLQLTAPVFRFDDSLPAGTVQSGFVLEKSVAYARINQVTGKIEHLFESFNHGARHEMSASAEYHWRELTFSASRTVEQVPDPRTMNRPLHWQTKEDKIGVVFDYRTSKRRVYLSVGGTLFFLQGVDSLSAVAVQNLLKTKIPLKNFGEVTAVVQADKIIQNKSGDPYYDVPATTQINADWNKSLVGPLSVGVKASVRRGPKIQPFAEPRMVDSPIFDGTQKENKLFIYFKIGNN
jgi:hypothetical protein